MRILFERGLGDFADFVQFGAQRRILGGVFPARAEHGADGGEDLAEFVVEFAGDVSQRGFLGGD